MTATPCAHWPARLCGGALLVFAHSVALGFAPSVQPAAPVDWRVSLPNIATVPGQVTLEARQAQVTLQNALELQVLSLNGTARPNGGQPLVNLDDPTSYRLQIDHARVVLSDAAIAQAVQAELGQSGAPIRVEAVRSLPAGMRVEGKIKRLGIWLPFRMEGMPQIHNPGEIVLKPSSMVVAGVPIYKALLATNMELASLVDMKSKSVFLRGQSLVLKPQQLMDKPGMDFDLIELVLLEGGIEAVLGRTPSAPPGFCKASLCPTSYVYTEGGAVFAAGLTLAGKPTLATAGENSPLTLSLPNLLGTVRASTVLLRPDGAAWINTHAPPLSASVNRALEQGVPGLASMKGDLPAHVLPRSSPLLLAVHRADLYTQQGVQVRVEKLLSASAANSLETLPNTEQQVLAGLIELDELALDALMNKHLFAYRGSPIRAVRTQVHPQGLSLELRVRPSILGLPTVWLPAQLQGQLLIGPDRRSLSFTPSEVRVLGLPVQNLLTWVGLSLHDLIHIDQPAVELSHNTLSIHLGHALPPMRLNTELQALRLIERSKQGAHVQIRVGLLDTQTLGQVYSAVEQLAPGLWLKTLSLEALGMRTGPNTAHVHTPEHATRLQVELARYPALLSDGEIRLPQPQQLVIQMPASQHPVQGHRDEQHAH
ncbi:MAG TPA: hypothetical protein VFV39_11925 [Limnobacter sp.]|nr:hypothetical protein [Limnobacter sp.]